MKKIFLSFLFATIGLSANANADVNFQCEIFGVVGGGGASGSLMLFGASPTEQSYQLKVSDGDSKEYREFDGSLYLRGQVDFTELNIETQDAISTVLEHSKKPSVVPGPLVVFANTNDASSTLKVYLMPSGEIAYIEVGFLPVLCS